jgi:hypothetical protein
MGVEGNRGDKYDPWPGPQGATSFDLGSCPSSKTYCDNRPSQVAIRNIQESAGQIAADFFVAGVTVRHQAVAVDDSPFNGFPNNGNGRAEPGETVQVDPSWKNTLTGPQTFTGTASNLTGPSGPSYTINDNSADYGTVGGMADRVAKGEDPQATKRAARSTGTFDDLADRYLEVSKKRNKSWKQADALVRKYLLPTWAKLNAKAATETASPAPSSTGAAQITGMRHLRPLSCHPSRVSGSPRRPGSARLPSRRFRTWSPSR